MKYTKIKQKSGRIVQKNIENKKILATTKKKKKWKYKTG